MIVFDLDSFRRRSRRIRVRRVTMKAAVTGDPNATDMLAESRNNLLHTTNFTLLDVTRWLMHIPLSNIRPFASETPFDCRVPTNEML